MRICFLIPLSLLNFNLQKVAASEGCLLRLFVCEMPRADLLLFFTANLSECNIIDLLLSLYD